MLSIFIPGDGYFRLTVPSVPAFSELLSILTFTHLTEDYARRCAKGREGLKDSEHILTCLIT